MDEHELSKDKAHEWIEELFSHRDLAQTNAKSRSELMDEMPPELRLMLPVDGAPTPVRESSAAERALNPIIDQPEPAPVPVFDQDRPECESARADDSWSDAAVDHAEDRISAHHAATADEIVADDFVATMLGESTSNTSMTSRPNDWSAYVDRDLDVRIDAMLLVFRRRIDAMISELQN
ncbi:MAG: hypothetical protein OEU32_15995 [Acidimicrobiia bacterium]|nr:hypothetical protein [Acidimicrobiia bacterium]